MRAFLDAHAALILRLARATLGASRYGAAPEDIAQDVVVLLLRTFANGTFDPERIENPEAYLRVVVRNAARGAMRRRSASERVGVAGDVGDGEDEAGEHEPASNPEELTRRALDARHMLETLKARLRPRDALVLALLVEEGLDIDEVAARLGTTLNSVYQMRHRILNEAREILGKNEAREALEHSRGLP